MRVPLAKSLTYSLIGLPLTFIMTGGLGGPLRYYTSWPLDRCLLCALPLAITLSYLAISSIKFRRPSRIETLVLVCTLACFALSIFLMIRSPVGPLIGGGDAGSHARFAFHAFGTPDTRYEGMVLFHTLALMLDRLAGTGLYQAFAILFFSTLIFVEVTFFLFFCTVAGDELKPELPERRFLTGFLLMAVISILTGIIPLIHNFEAQGFYPQVFGLVPLCLSGLFYAMANSWKTRLLGLAFGFFLYRHTYVLNLGDYAFACAVAYLAESFALSKKTKVGIRLAAFAWFVCSGVIYFRLAPLRMSLSAIPGAPYRTGALLLALSAFIVLWLRFRPNWKATWSPSAQRLLLFFGFFGLAAAAVKLSFITFDLPRRYYFYKYGLHACTVLGLLGLSLFAALWARFLVQRNKLSVSLVLLAACLCLFPRFARYYHRPFLEHLLGKPPFQYVNNLWDRETYESVRRVLMKKDYQFGGIADVTWQRTNFLNGIFGKPGDVVYFTGQLDTTSAHCVFWLNAQALSGNGNFPALLTSLFSSLKKFEPGNCQSQPAVDLPPPSIRTLCYRCF